MTLLQPISARVTIPRFERGIAIVGRHAARLRPKEKLTVSQWATRHLPDYDPEMLPFLAEIMDACGDPETAQVGDMGPAQGGKSKVGEAFIGWSIHQDPMPFMVVQPDKAAMETFVKLRIGTMIAGSAALKAELAPHQSADNMHLKLFRGMYLGCAWPVKSQFRQRTYARGWLDDFDAFPGDIEGEGDAIGLLEGRMTFYKGQDTMLVSSSPGREDGSGIEAFIDGGTDERLQPVCPSCGDRVELDLIRDLKFDDDSTADDAADSAHVVCPANGCILLPDARHALLRSCATLPHRSFVASKSENGVYRRTFRRDGLLSFTSWGDLARQLRDAQIAWETRQDEGPLRTFWNTKAGKNYRSQTSGDKPVEVRDLEKRREPGWKLGTVPRGPIVINIVIDVQHDRFEIGVIGTANDRETWVVDRFPIDVMDDGLTSISPFVHKEHWKVLLPLFDRKWPLAETGPDGKPVGYAQALSVTVDTGGSDKKGDQATEGAKYFWHAARALGIPASRITLVKGASKPSNVDLMPPARFADQKAKGGARRNSAKLWLPNVSKLKSMIDARLRRTTPGPGYIHLPSDFSDTYVAEMTAEQLVKGKWEKLRPRNETWDILVYAEAALLKPPFAQSRPHMRWVPRDFRIVWSTESAEPASCAADVVAPVVAQEPPPPPLLRQRQSAQNEWIQLPQQGSSWL